MDINERGPASPEEYENARLAAKTRHLESQVAMLREALEIAIDCRPIGYETLTECREHKIRRALAATPSDWLRKHDAEIREQMLDLFRGKHRDYANELAAELEGEKHD